ncbi:SpoIIE family protein phosphatase [Motilibacter deserti]|uniref:SpoIIE family protein phosphatase n=1 Tax=Motilibacter deserti TaxID=2714956 RepID=A0ABX0GRH4_9ACTN|nr:SpoIIE family protein phosphatase [Motilibacter deserti]NHC13342.1 SpoIIE family protein phosphatase [Motilibacter deserti]
MPDPTPPPPAAQLHELAKAAFEVRAVPGADDLLARVVERARELVGAHQALLVRAADDGAGTPPIAASVASRPGWSPTALPAALRALHDVVVRTNAPLRLDHADLEAHPAYAAAADDPELAEWPALRGLLAVPLVARDRSNLGVLQLSDKYAEAGFTPADEAVAVQLAQLVAVAVESRADAERLTRSEERYEALVAATSDAVWAVDAEFRSIGDQPSWRALTGQEPGGDLGLGWLDAVHPDDRPHVVAAVDRAVRTGERYEATYRVQSEGRAERWLRARGVPVTGDDDGTPRVVGWVGGCSDITDIVQSERARQDLTARAAAATRRVELLQQVTAALAEALTTADVSAVVTGPGRGMLGAAECALVLLDEQGGVRRTASAGPLDASLVDRLAEVGRTGEPVFGRPDEAAGGGGALALLPLGGADGAAGALALTWAHEREFSAEERVFLTAVAAQCASALARARLYDELAERAARQTLLLDATERLSGSLERDEVLEQLAALVVPELADWAVVHLLDGQGPALRATAVAAKDPVVAADLRLFFDQFPVAVGEPYGAGAVVASGRPQLLDRPELLGAERAGPEPGPLPEALGALPPSTLVVPLSARGRAFGALTLARADCAYGPEEQAFADDLARRAALAVDNAALYSAQREAAVTLQRSLLPQSLPAVEGLEFVAHYVPGADGTEVGGDWYDAFELPGGRVGIAVGDTMGRGVGAAAVMGQVRAALRGYALEGHIPAEVLRRLDLVVRAFDELRLTTCVYAVYDPRTRWLSVASAGHLPPLVLEPGRPARFLDLDPGLPLGVGAELSTQDAPFREHVVALRPDATVLLYTDGLVERRDVVADEGMEALRSALDGVERSPREVLDLALGRTGQLEAPTGQDDVAVLAVRAVGGLPGMPGQRRALEVELSPSLHAARTARGRVLSALTEWGHGGSEDAGGPGGFEAVDAVVLLTDELVTNAVVHAHSPLLLELSATADHVRVAVTDESPRLPAPRGQSQDSADALDAVSEGGRGLRLVELLASRWGVDRLPVGKRIWFEVDLPAEAAPGG